MLRGQQEKRLGNAEIVTKRLQKSANSETVLQTMELLVLRSDKAQVSTAYIQK